MERVKRYTDMAEVLAAIDGRIARAKDDLDVSIRALAEWHNGRTIGRSGVSKSTLRTERDRRAGGLAALLALHRELEAGYVAEKYDA